jgi:hypothetical protein
VEEAVAGGCWMLARVREAVSKWQGATNGGILWGRRGGKFWPRLRC